jgi:hypothetical protein
VDPSLLAELYTPHPSEFLALTFARIDEPKARLNGELIKVDIVTKQTLVDTKDVL